jgi:hypothetical protein
VVFISLDTPNPRPRGWLDVKVDVDGQAKLLVLDAGANNLDPD